MDPIRKYTAARDILQIEEKYRDAAMKAALTRGDDYRQLIDKLLSADAPIAASEEPKS